MRIKFGLRIPCTLRMSSRTARTVRDLAIRRWLNKLACIIYDVGRGPLLALGMTPRDLFERFAPDAAGVIQAGMLFGADYNSTSAFRF
jgi:hypothetical protein